MSECICTVIWTTVGHSTHSSASTPVGATFETKHIWASGGVTVGGAVVVAVEVDAAVAVGAVGATVQT